MTTFAVAFIVIVTGLGPQSKAITPPEATPATTASEVQLAGVPVPITVVASERISARVVGCELVFFRGCAVVGSASGLGFLIGVALAEGDLVGVGVTVGVGLVDSVVVGSAGMGPGVAV
ncbi:MAG: hypothetical protein ACK5LS_01015 [Propioniciclava sp.]